VPDESGKCLEMEEGGKEVSDWVGISIILFSFLAGVCTIWYYRRSKMTDLVRPCDVCRGTGKVEDVDCPACCGTGYYPMGEEADEKGENSENIHRNR